MSTKVNPAFGYPIQLPAALQQPGHPFSPTKPLATKPYLLIDGSHGTLFDYMINVGAIFYGWLDLFVDQFGLDEHTRKQLQTQFQASWDPFQSLVYGALIAHPQEPAQPLSRQVFQQRPIPMPNLAQPDNPAFADYFKAKIQHITGLLSRFVPTGKAAAYTELTRQADILAGGVHNLVEDVIQHYASTPQP